MAYYWLLILNRSHVILPRYHFTHLPEETAGFERNDADADAEPNTGHSSQTNKTESEFDNSDSQRKVLRGT